MHTMQHHDTLSSTRHHDACTRCNTTTLSQHVTSRCLGRKRRRQLDIVDKAMSGETGPLLDYIRDHLDDEIELPDLSPSDWFKVLPSWYGRGKPRALKGWSSTTVRHNWSINALCAKAINQALTVYMYVLGVPPVCEGEDTDDGFVVKEGGIDLMTTFIVCLHVGYCKFLHPPVEEGTDAHHKVLQYMHTRVVKLRLLRAVRYHDVMSRYPITMLYHDTVSRHSITMLYHDTVSRHQPSTGHVSHDSCARN